MTRIEELRAAVLSRMREYDRGYNDAGEVIALTALEAEVERVAVLRGREEALTEVGCTLEDWQRPGASNCIEAKVIVVNYGPGGNVEYEMTPERRCKNCRLLAEVKAARESTT